MGIAALHHAMAYRDAASTSERLSAALAAGAIQAVAILALMAGLAATAAVQEGQTLSAVFIEPSPSPTPPRLERERPAPRPEPAGRKGSALPREAPKAAVPFRVPAAAPTAESGAATASAPGDSGQGTGTGGAGNGPGGGGGGGTTARRIGGALSDRDYPAAMARQRAAGTVVIRYRIGTDGRVRACEIVRSSGHPELDDLTCRLVQQRFRYAPARDAAGLAVEDSAGTSFTWGTRN